MSPGILAPFVLKEACPSQEYARMDKTLLEGWVRPLRPLVPS